MTFYEFTKWYWEIYEKVEQLLKINFLLASGELETLTENVTGDFDELIKIIVKGEYHFYCYTWLGYIADNIYHKKLDYDETGYEYKCKPDILIDEGYIGSYENDCVIKFFDKKFLADKYKQRKQEIKQKKING